MENKENDKKITVGKDSVVIGNVSGNVGDGSVVIGATDAYGNVILNQSMAIGKNAYASEGSIAIGTNAGAGNQLANILHQIKLIIDQTGDDSAISKFNLFELELKKEKPNKGVLKSTWAALKNIGSVNGMIGIFNKLEHFLPFLTGSS